MYDFAFDLRALERELTKSDFKAYPQLLDNEFRKSLINRAIEQAGAGFADNHIRFRKFRGKTVYEIDDLAQSLVYRKFTRNIRIITNLKQSDRNTIVKAIINILSEGHPFRVYKLDLKSFYESIDRSAISDRLSFDRGLPPATVGVFKFIDSQLVQQGVQGLPRGMSVSAILSEYAMRSFDRNIKSHDCVYFYARYVDDIIIITTMREDKKSFIKFAQSCLPLGCEINYSKTKVLDFRQPKATGAASNLPEGAVEFLGYRFSVGRIVSKDNLLRREISIDMSRKKVCRIKTRIILSIIQFEKDRNFLDLFDRLRVISGNYNVYDFSKGLRRNVGIYYSYRFLENRKTSALQELDAFLKGIFLAKNGRVSSIVNELLTSQQRRLILTLSFARSFEKKNFCYFRIGRLTKLVRCWAYA